MFSLRHSIPVGPALSIGVAGELGWVSVPILLDGAAQTSDSAAIWRAAILPSWRSGALTLFGGLHLTNDFEVSSSILTDPVIDQDPDAHSAGLVVIAAGGAAVRVSEHLKLTAHLAKPVSSEVDHGLQLGVALGLELGD